MPEADARGGAWLALAAAVAVAALAAAVLLRQWALAAVPVGLLVGFTLEKGDLCGASAMSEVLVFRDRGKLFGLWVAVVSSMVVFAALDVAGLARANPKPLQWLSMAAGGLVFGVGTVLGGGCVSGCLYKAGAGNLNSMAALVGIPLGVGLVEAGPLANLNRAMRGQIVSHADGRPLTAASLLGLPAWAVALAVAVATAALVCRRRRRAGWSRMGLRGPWRPWQAGLALGLLGGVGWLSSAAVGRNYPLGVTHGPYHAAVLALSGSPQEVWHRQAGIPLSCSPDAALPVDASAIPAIVWWLVALCAGLVAGSFVSARLSGRARLLPRPPGETVVAFFGGILTGMGAGIASGCVLGNIVSGIGLLSLGALVFALATFLGNLAATRLYLMGGWPRAVTPPASPRA